MTYYPPPTVISVYTIFTVVGFLLTCLRFWVRLSNRRAPPRPGSYVRRSLGLDDYLILFGWVVVCVCTGIQIHDALYGVAGEVLSDREKISRQLTQYKADFVMKLIEKLAFGAIKLSLLFFYNRIFGFWPSFRKINITLIVFVALWTVSFFLADIFLCGAKPQLQWQLDQKALRAKCGEEGASLIAFAATSVLTDLMVLVLPLVYVRRLQMRRSKKIATSFIFLLGGLSTLAGILRLIWLCISYPSGRLLWGYKAPPEGEEPLVLQIFNPTFWVMMEMMLGTWAANLPALAPIGRAIIERLRGTQSLSKLLGTSTDASGDNPRKYSEASVWTGEGGLRKMDSAVTMNGRAGSSAAFV